MSKNPKMRKMNRSIVKKSSNKMGLGQKNLGLLKLQVERLMTQLTMWIQSLPIQALIKCVSLTFALN